MKDECHLCARASGERQAASGGDAFPLAVTRSPLAATASTSQFELGPAAVLHPDPAIVIAPGAAEDAFGGGDLTGELHAVAGVSGADGGAAVARLTEDALAVPFALALAVMASAIVV